MPSTETPAPTAEDLEAARELRRCKSGCPYVICAPDCERAKDTAIALEIRRARADGARSMADAVKLAVVSVLMKHGENIPDLHHNASLDESAWSDDSAGGVYARALVAALSTADAPAAPPSPVGMRDRVREILGRDIRETVESMGKLHNFMWAERVLLAILKLIDDETGGGDGKT